jgi:protein-disulfide isomerase
LQALLADGAAPAFGPADAEVTIVEFGDFQSSYAARASGAVAIIQREYADTVRFVFRQFPAPSGTSRLAAEASLAADAQGKFWEYHDLLFANQRSLEQASLERYARELGMDAVALRQSLAERKFAQDVERDLGLGRRVGVTMAPAMFVNGRRVHVPVDIVALRQLIETGVREAK